MPQTVRRPYCQAEGCVAYSTFGLFCDEHHAIRRQHQTSHRLDGHEEGGPIEMCPKCEPKKT